MPIDPAKALTTTPATNRAAGTSQTTATGAAGSAAQANGAQSMMNKDDFLKLLIGQMQNQDPLNPMDPAESMGQMTQFAILEQVTNLNSTTTAAASNDYDAQAVALVGRYVTYYDARLRDSVTGRVEGVRFTSQGPLLTVDGEDGIPPVSLLSVSDRPIELPEDPPEEDPAEQTGGAGAV